MQGIQRFFSCFNLFPCHQDEYAALARMKLLDKKSLICFCCFWQTYWEKTKSHIVKIESMCHRFNASLAQVQHWHFLAAYTLPPWMWLWDKELVCWLIGQISQARPCWLLTFFAYLVHCLIGGLVDLLTWWNGGLIDCRISLYRSSF